LLGWSLQSHAVGGRNEEGGKLGPRGLSR